MRKFCCTFLFLLIPFVANSFSELAQKSFGNFTTFQDIYKQIHTEIVETPKQKVFITTVIDRVCEREFINCENLEIVDRENLTSFQTNIIKSENSNANKSFQYSILVQNLVAEESADLLWEYQLERTAKFNQLFSDGDGAKPGNKKVEYAYKNSPFDMVRNFDNFETIIFGNKKTTTWTPSFLIGDKDEIDTSLGADKWVDQENTKILEGESFLDTNGSVIGQNFRTNKKVFTNSLNQKPLTCIRNTKGILKDTFCDDAFPTPVTNPNSFSVPTLSKDESESKKVPSIDVYRTLLEVYENQDSCTVLTSGSLDISVRLQSLSLCELKRSLELQNTVFETKKKLTNEQIRNDNEKTKRFLNFTHLFTDFAFSKEGESSIIESFLKIFEALLNKPRR